MVAVPFVENFLNVPEEVDYNAVKIPSLIFIKLDLIFTPNENLWRGLDMLTMMLRLKKLNHYLISVHASFVKGNLYKGELEFLG